MKRCHSQVLHGPSAKHDVVRHAVTAVQRRWLSLGEAVQNGQGPHYSTTVPNILTVSPRSLYARPTDLASTLELKVDKWTSQKKISDLPRQLEQIIPTLLES